VHIANPTIGEWSVRVKGAAVAQGTQGYGLVVTGDIQGGTPPPLIINLPGGAPALVPPETTHDLTVQIIPGSQSIAPGSPTMWYRASASQSFIAMPMTSLGGNAYRATLPAAACGAEPEFYFTAEGDQGAIVSLPANAPATTFGTLIGTMQTTTIAEIDLDQTLPAGWSATGLWH